jgi:hypothetical protein
MTPIPGEQWLHRFGGLKFGKGPKSHLQNIAFSEKRKRQDQRPAKKAFL